MSLILEALKKSEQQRRLGEAPDLGTPVIGVRRRRSLLPILLVAIALALVAGWWLARRPATTAPGVAQTSSAPSAPTQPSSATAQPPAAQHAAPPPTAVPAHPVAPAHVALPATPPITHPQPAAPTPAPPPVAPAAAAPQAATPAAAPGAIAPPSAAVTAPSRPPVAQPAAPDLPLAWQLPYATRKDLPALTMTMHVYAADPKERFVILNGDRHAAGDDLGNGLKLAEIRADGIVLEFRGQRFLLPRGGR